MQYKLRCILRALQSLHETGLCGLQCEFFLSYSKQIQLLCAQKLVEMYAVYVKSVLLLR